ncbi:Protein THEM6 [Madurella mycetomatis]|uniref:Protein THEM6 n=1 Tax=Madurella mycetomatis TaxID=100816 RepID=A0A175W2I2_9PEZI|nr:Protein THEM6 [Madurella mycetomatis]
MAVGTLALFYPVFVPMSVASLAYAGHRAFHLEWRTLLTQFLTGPGRTSRILLVFFLILNWKSLPLAWTVRIFHSFIYHVFHRPKKLPQRALFHYSLSSSRTSLLETDYNIHKSNSTYFADLDVSRSHLVTHLLGPGLPIIGDNAKNKRVRDKEGNLIKGTFGIGLGAVFCSFRKEIAPLQGYEMWSRILSWDRKWMYIVTHFVVKGKVRPTSWDGKRMGPTRDRVQKADGSGEPVEDWSKYVIATAVSKYVYKLGRFTVHPALVIDAAGLLPERPGEGWTGGDTGTGTPEDLGDLDEDGEWDWKRVEFERRKGMEYAEHFAALDGTNALFDGGEDGAIGKFPLG